MSRVVVHTDEVPAPVGPYSQSARAGSWIAVAGQIGAEAATGRVVSEDVSRQTRQALANVERIVEASGASMDDIVRVGVFLTNRDDFAAMNDVYRQVFSEPFPARTTVYVGLPEGVKVEIDAIAVNQELATHEQ